MQKQCTTVKPGKECFFMKKACSYTGGACKPVVESCEGCKHVVEWPEGKYCDTYADPTSKWAFGSCNFATHVEAPKVQEKASVNPLKASKRAAAGRR